MGVVYKARDMELDRPVAIKMVLDSATEDGAASEEAIARFLREAKAASRLQHPAIVHIYQFGVEENTRYLAMEFIEGQNLRALINRRPLPVEKICDIGAQVADGLAVAHEQGIVHRDLKVENIMVTSRGQAKILDFGLAKVQDRASADDATMDEKFMTQLGTVLGTASSMSPEQAMGRDADPKADVFSLGVVFYEMATGQNPFIAPTAQATLARILNHQPELVSLVNPAIPPELERLIHLCLRKEPKQRPTAAEVTNICKRLLATVNQWGGTSAAPANISAPAAMAPLPSTPPAAFTSLLKPPSSKAVAAPPPASAAAAMALGTTYRLIKTFRIALSILTMLVALSYFFYMLIGANILRPEIVEGTTVWKWVLAIVVPSLTLCEKIFAFHAVVGGWNLLLAGLGVAALLARYLILMPIEHVEFKAKAKYIKAKGTTSSSSVAPSASRNADDRLTLLRQYSDGQRGSVTGTRMAVLSIDIIGWTRMIAQEDPLVAEHAHAEYKKFVDRILRTNSAAKTAFTNEGILSAFPAADNAVIAAKAILRDIGWFNEGIHRLQSAFHVRCGINVGSLDIPNDKPLEEVNSEVIDLAATMQKTATADSIRVSGDVLAQVSDNSGFDIAQGAEVDGRVVYEYREAGGDAMSKSESA
jgi:class 3 adenylate cyclase